MLVYCILSQLPATGLYAFYMFLFSPFVMVWMVLSILRHGTYNGRPLDGDEPGYQDKATHEPETF